MRQKAKQRLFFAFVTLVYGSFFPMVARADLAGRLGNAKKELEGIAKKTDAVQSTMSKLEDENKSPERKLAAGDFFYSLKRYPQALIFFSQVIEENANTKSEPEALWRRGRTFYASKEFLSAGRDFRTIIEKGKEPAFSTYRSKALASLIDVYLHNGDLKKIEGVLTQIDQLPKADIDEPLLYAEGKAYYALGHDDKAAQVFSEIKPAQPFSFQSRYFLGLIEMRRAAMNAGDNLKGPNLKAQTPTPTKADFSKALDLFKRLAETPPHSDEEQRTVDLAWMALGRMYYTKEEYGQAEEAYSKMSSSSQEFETALYELAWVYIRMGNVKKAAHALELLSVSDPDSSEVARSLLLRADLLLRNGSFSKALDLYESVKMRYAPILAKLDTFISHQGDVSAFYEKLSAPQLNVFGDEYDGASVSAMRWVRAAADRVEVSSFEGDIARAKDLIGESHTMAEKLKAIVLSPNKVKLSSRLVADEEELINLVYKVTAIRMEIAKGLDELGELNQDFLANVRAKRKQLMAGSKALPLERSGLQERYTKETKQWDQSSREWSGLQSELDQLQAMLNGLRWPLRSRTTATLEPKKDQAPSDFQNQIQEEDMKLARYATQVAALRKQLDFAQLQTGFAGLNLIAEVRVKSELGDALEQEVALMLEHEASNSNKSLLAEVAILLQNARKMENRLIQFFDSIEAKVARRADDVLSKIHAEEAKIDGYERELFALESSQKKWMGEIAQKQFKDAKDQLQDLVLRADIGIGEQAWEVREEELFRVRALQGERSQREQSLDREMHYILDDEPVRAPSDNKAR